MRVYSWNINGLRAVQRKGFLDWMKQEKPDLISLQETKIQDEQLPEDLKDIPGYYSYFSFAEKKGYSGVALYSKEEPLSVQDGIGIKRFDREGRVLVSEFPEFTFLGVYFPNGKMSAERLQYKLDFYDAILDYCEGLRNKGKNLVVSGDYNTAHQEIDLKNPRANEKRSGFLPVERAWLDKFIACGYVDTFRKLYPEQVTYSWWDYRTKARGRNAGWRIDYHFVNQEFFSRVKDADILTDVMGSDHCPVVLELE